MPLPINTTPNRFGVSVVAPQTGIDSSHGSAIVTPAPRRNILRDDFDLLMLLTFRRVGIGRPPVAKLWTPHDRIDQGLKTMIVRGERAADVFQRGLVGKDQAATQCVREELAAEISDEIVLPVLADIGADAFKAVPFSSSRELGVCIDSPAGEVRRALLTDRAVAFEDQTERVEARMATG